MAEFPQLIIYSYDISKQIFEWEGSLKNSIWMNVYDDELFIINAFIYARKYAPNGCKLYLSENEEYYEKKSEKIINI